MFAEKTLVASFALRTVVALAYCICSLTFVWLLIGFLALSPVPSRIRKFVPLKFAEIEHDGSKQNGEEKCY